MNAELNASYKKVFVTVPYRSQLRLCRLHIIVPIGKEPIYFLYDYYGWSIDDDSVKRNAIEKYSRRLYSIDNS